MSEFLVALAGSPNVGKSTLFNRITGGNVQIANWAGVTLQKFEGALSYGGARLKIVDLPGTYSLSARNVGERIAREFILKEKPDVLVLVTDVTSLEKSLYLVVNALELYSRVVLALNMMDVAEKRGIQVNVEGLERGLGVPVVPISALKGIGIGKLLGEIIEVAEGRAGRKEPLRVDYDGLERFIAKLERKLSEIGFERHLCRWAAVRLLEGDEVLMGELSEKHPEVANEVMKMREEVRVELATDPESLVISSRYEFIEDVLRESVSREVISRPLIEEALDSLLLHPIAGPVASVAIMLLTFFAVFTLNMGFPANIILRVFGFEELSDLIEEYNLTGLLGSLFDSISSGVGSLLSSLKLDDFLVRLLSEGVIGSLGTLFSFIPLLLITYLVLGALQDSGVLPRAATSLDNFFRRFGLSGKAFFPAALGLGCSVPGVVACRGLEDEEERLVVSISEPFIPCQAKLIVLLAVTAAAFQNPVLQASLIVSIYLLGILIFLLSSKILRKLLFGVKEVPDLLIELPPYRIPSSRVIWWFVKANTLQFLRKAGMIIFTLGISSWLLLNTGPSVHLNDVSESFASILGSFLAPFLFPVGLADWRFALALEAGLVSRESLLVIFSSIANTPDPVSAIREIGITPLKAVSLSLLMSFYVPCLATLSTILSELRRVKYVAIAVMMELVVAFLLSSLIYLGGSALGFK
ncbi:MAG: ferrous iron transport protein B [Candidatus Korarchaeum sp.]|nr:ferrous iron transport protein B [Candidatus Korarchaeum sp.]